MAAIAGAGSISANTQLAVASVTASGDIGARDVIASRNLTVAGASTVKGSMQVTGDASATAMSLAGRLTLSLPRLSENLTGSMDTGQKRCAMLLELFCKSNSAHRRILFAWQPGFFESAKSLPRPRFCELDCILAIRPLASRFASTGQNLIRRIGDVATTSSIQKILAATQIERICGQNYFCRKA